MNKEIKAWVELQDNINMQKTFDNITTNLRPLDREILSKFIIEKDTLKNITEWLNSELGLDLTTWKTRKIITTIQNYLWSLHNELPNHIRYARKMGLVVKRFIPTTNAPATPHTIVETKKFIGDICISRTINWK
tara:strand:+ start:80 stop:481 length:402 start_codon:yes stop_codon:yes gene_type:complete